MRRRTLLALPAVGLAAAALAACSDRPSGRVGTVADGASTERITYGGDPSQWADLHTPSGESRGLVVVIHGGFWKAQYGADYGAPLAEDLVGRGWTAANLEYRRVGNGGGFPQTLDDIHAAIGAVAADATGPVVTLGHSAGGHLATWAAARGRFDRWSGGPALTHVISQAGVVDLRSAVADHLGSDAALAFLGDAGESAYAQADPLTQVPLDVPMWAVHASDDDVVPIGQSEAYVDAATAAGAEATLVEVAGGHFGVIDPTSEAWAACVKVLDSIA
jgi:acetyl esterase/lipase